MRSDVILAADIGGTNARFAIIERSASARASAAFRIVRKEVVATGSITDFSSTVKRFLQGASVQACGIAAAGPVIERGGKRSITLTNAPLTIRERSLPCARALLLNDVEALGYAIGLPGTTRMVAGRRRKGVSAVITLGTGLGHAMVAPAPDKTSVMVFASEAGHAPFPLASAEEHGLAAFVNALSERAEETLVTAEQLLSGRGITRIYDFYRASRYPHTPPLDAPAIMKGESSCSRASVALFKHLLARWCQSFLLTTLTSNLFLGGGVVLHNQELIDEEFLRLVRKHPDAQYQRLLESVAIGLFKPDANLRGAARAVTLLKR